ncbi:MAG: hypothetical protein HRT69_16915 [Flavobacteriaceae bacterium]|nr:hypothetical protein [Flavobacteriaceae bacterium]
MQKEIAVTNYDDDAKLGYTITKDNSHLYITLSTKEKTTQLKIMSNGVRIFFDKEGKKRKNKELNSEYIKVNHQMSLDGLVYTLKVPLIYIATTQNLPTIGISINGMQSPEMGNRPTGRPPDGRGLSGRGIEKGMKGFALPLEIRGNISLIEELQSDINIWVALDIQ